MFEFKTESVKNIDLVCISSDKSLIAARSHSISDDSKILMRYAYILVGEVDSTE